MYTQPPHLSDAEIQSLLEEEAVARICSLNEDGTIHATTVNYKYEAGRITVATPSASRKARNLERNGEVTILVDVIGEGLSKIRGAIVYGRAELQDIEFSQFLAINEAWMSSEKVEDRTRALMELTDWVLISIEPQNVASWDYAKDKKFAAVFMN